MGRDDFERFGNEMPQSPSDKKKRMKNLECTLWSSLVQRIFIVVVILILVIGTFTINVRLFQCWHIPLVCGNTLKFGFLTRNAP